MVDRRREDAAGSPHSTHTGIPVGNPGDSIGSYRLLERIGEGGMGEVWLAEQVRPVRRHVALKLIKAGLDSSQVIARFDAERQALALMDHPAIAKVFDAGTTDLGRPYFAMEFVRGESITEYCDHQRLTIRERLQLFVDVCEGVQHAHQKGIIHRDLKPANILVTIQSDRPAPKIIDFGIAKATSQRLTEQTLHTSLAGFIGTPEYMSPEQADMSSVDVDTRTDVYSMGVVLYELLTGTLPFARQPLLASGFEEMRRLIREVEPVRPSVHVTRSGSAETAWTRRTEPPRLAKQLRGDLDWITMKALEKNRTRRYGSASELAADIRRHLSDEPVSAGPPSGLYRARKFIVRHRFGVITAAVLVVLVLSSAIALAVQARRTAGERDRANREAETARQISSFLRSLFEVSRPSEATANTVTAREILDKGAERIRHDTQLQPGTRAALLGTMGDVYYSLGSYEKAQSLLEQALRDGRDVIGSHSAETAAATFRLGQVLRRRGQLDGAEKMSREALDMRTTLFGRRHPEVAAVLTELGTIAADRGDYVSAEKLLDEALDIERSVSPVPQRETAKSLVARGRVFYDKGDFASAERNFRQAMEIYASVGGPAHPDTLGQAQNVAATLMARGDYSAAEATYRNSLQEMARTLGSEHAELGTLWLSLGAVQYYQEKYVDAEASYRRALAISRAAFTSEHEFVGSALINLGQSLYAQTRYKESNETLREGIGTVRRTLGSDHPTVVPGLTYLARTMLAMGQQDEAERVARESLAIALKALGSSHPWTKEAEGALGMVLVARRRWPDAEPLLLSYYAALESNSSVDGKRHEVARLIAAMYAGWGKRQEAAVWKAKATP